MKACWLELFYGVLLGAALLALALAAAFLAGRFLAILVASQSGLREGWNVL